MFIMVLRDPLELLSGLRKSATQSFGIITLKAGLCKIEPVDEAAHLCEYYGKQMASTLTLQCLLLYALRRHTGQKGVAIYFGIEETNEMWKTAVVDWVYTDTLSLQLTESLRGKLKLICD